MLRPVWRLGGPAGARATMPRASTASKSDVDGGIDGSHGRSDSMAAAMRGDDDCLNACEKIG